MSDWINQERLAFIGILIGIMLSLSPVPTFIDIAIHSKSTGGYTVAPYIASLMTCSVWLLYAFMTAKSDLIPLNVISFVVYTVYCGVFLFYSPSRFQVVKLYMFAVAVLAIAVIIAVFTRSHVAIGVIATVANCLMFAAPMAVIQLVVQTRSVRYMPFMLSLFSFLCGLVWFAWAIVVTDYFVMIPNGVGSILGLVQLVIYGFFWKYGSPNEEREELREEDELTPMAKKPLAGQTADIPPIYTNSDWGPRE